MRPPPLDRVRLPEARLTTALRRSLVEAVGGFHVRDDAETRVRHAAGRSYVDLLRLRSGTLDSAPDAVAYPGNAAEVLAVLRACTEHECAVVPFGGGTSVVGGVAPLRDGMRCVIAVDVERLDSASGVDAIGMTATLQAGMRGPHIEAVLNARGMTLGHFPQSFEYATAGGFAATRSAGQASSQYGRFDEMAAGLAMQSPSGELITDALPPAATGPSLLQALLGSEGTLGVITEVTVRVHPLPHVEHYAAWSLPDLAHGLDVMRQLAQDGGKPHVARLSDADETRAAFAMSSGRATPVARRYLRVRGQPAPCLMVLGWEGDGDVVGQRVRVASRVLRRAGAVGLGAAPARAWRRDRFQAPYLRDALLDRGVLVETLETVTRWSAVDAVRRAVRGALISSLSERAQPLIGCHVSHIYRDGASLYFTVLAEQRRGDAVEQWVAAKRAATDALLAQGAALSHHHGVGVDHSRWMPSAVGERGMALLQALKRELDPTGVMNPGKLLVASEPELTTF